MMLVSVLFTFDGDVDDECGLESVRFNSEHDHAGMADKADGTVVLALPEVTFLWYRYDEQLCPLLHPFPCLPNLQACCCHLL